jgi:16S rRNA (uracil1498-N3)-methyltransferase
MGAFRADIPALFAPQIGETRAAVTITGSELSHARSLRLRVGDPLLLLDGNGTRAESVVTSFDRSAMTARVESVVFEHGEIGAYIGLALGLLSDRARLDWCFEKGTELGVRRFVPMITARSEGRLNVERARRVTVAALKQSQRAYLPAIDEPVPFSAPTEETLTTADARPAASAAASSNSRAAAMS